MKLIESLREKAGKATPGPWFLADGCSWRRILTERHEPVCVPTIIDSDNHPDLLLHGPKGMHDNGPLIAACSPDVILALCDAAEALRVVYAHTGVSASAMSNAAIDSLLGSIERQCAAALAKLDAMEQP